MALVRPPMQALQVPNLGWTSQPMLRVSSPTPAFRSSSPAPALRAARFTPSINGGLPARQDAEDISKAWYLLRRARSSTPSPRQRVGNGIAETDASPFASPAAATREAEIAEPRVTIPGTPPPETRSVRPMLHQSQPARLTPAAPADGSPAARELWMRKVQEAGYTSPTAPPMLPGTGIGELQTQQHLLRPSSPIKQPALVIPALAADRTPATSSVSVPVPMGPVDGICAPTLDARPHRNSSPAVGGICAPTLDARPHRNSSPVRSSTVLLQQSLTKFATERQGFMKLIEELKIRNVELEQRMVEQQALMDDHGRQFLESCAHLEEERDQIREESALAEATWEQRFRAEQANWEQRFRELEMRGKTQQDQLEEQVAVLERQTAAKEPRALINDYEQMARIMDDHQKAHDKQIEALMNDQALMTEMMSDEGSQMRARIEHLEQDRSKLRSELADALALQEARGNSSSDIGQKERLDMIARENETMKDEATRWQGERELLLSRVSIMERKLRLADSQNAALRGELTLLREQQRHMSGQAASSSHT
eukprot:gnl/TRDRNA2_/TRDRNA2_159870_c2_seq1.p1 gnl/TRDRNA2_/TRDRNA2_159870_c2~~gnl/TRDRNA2_/TRDRNA2_159870_c2_seq1.p1  ORF type:complete len:543 (+),score=106.87 gnl/TRDRNA2_/TRDRNA2_159870_c2_seq1:88-1716(+)